MVMSSLDSEWDMDFILCCFPSVVTMKELSKDYADGLTRENHIF